MNGRWVGTAVKRDRVGDGGRRLQRSWSGDVAEAEARKWAAKKLRDGYWPVDVWPEEPIPGLFPE